MSGGRFILSQKINDTPGGTNIYTLGKLRLRREPVVKHCHRHRGAAQSGYYEREEMSSQCSLVGFNSHLILIFPLESLTIRTYCHTGVEIGDRRWGVVSPFKLHTTCQNTNSPIYQTTNTPTYQNTNLATYQGPKPIDSLLELGSFSYELSHVEQHFSMIGFLMLFHQDIR